MRIAVNGAPREVPEWTTVAELLGWLALAEVRLAVEVNRQVVPAGERAARRLAGGDEVEIVSFVGGG